jgi:hypothetical protein
MFWSVNGNIGGTAARGLSAARGTGIVSTGRPG